MRRHTYYVAYRGSYEDPDMQVGISGPYPTKKAAEDWVTTLKTVRRIMGPIGQKQPLYIVHCISKL